MQNSSISKILEIKRPFTFIDNIAFVIFFPWNRWGGVILINPPVETCMTVKSDELVTIVPEQTIVVGTFLTQLKLLLGIPEPVIILAFSIFIGFFYFFITDLSMM